LLQFSRVQSDLWGGLQADRKPESSCWVD
jgi:hypothetical protein